MDDNIIKLEKKLPERNRLKENFYAIKSNTIVAY